MRERERERERQTDRQRQRQTDRQTERQRERQTDRQTEHRQTDTETGTDKKTDIKKNDRLTETDSLREKGGPDKQAERERETREEGGGTSKYNISPRSGPNQFRSLKLILSACKQAPISVQTEVTHASASGGLD